MQFKKVIGQAELKQKLIKGVLEDRISHAQLFLGQEGCGNLALALAYAQYVNCWDRQAEDSCGRCRSCIKARKLIHPDIHYTYPTVGSKMKSSNFAKEWRVAMLDNPYLNVHEWLQRIGAENKQGNITKDECEDILRRLSLKIYEGRYKICIIWMPEYLRKEGNRLLKLIEEPPAKTLFLLVALNTNLILNTILSRTQVVKVKRLTDSEIADWLIQNKGIPQATAQQIAALSEGNYNGALALLEHGNNDNQQLLIRWLGACLGKNVIAISKWVEEVAKIGRENQKNFLRYCLHFFRQCIFIQLAITQQTSLSREEINLSQQLMQQIGLEQLERLSTLLNKSIYYVERNAHSKVLFLNLSVQTRDIIEGKR